LPWLALLRLRAFFLRDFLAIALLPDFGRDDGAGWVDPMSAEYVRVGNPGSVTLDGLPA